MPVDPRAVRRRPNELGVNNSPPSAPLLPGGPGPSAAGPQYGPPPAGPDLAQGIVPDASQLGPDMFDMQGGPLPLGDSGDQAPLGLAGADLGAGAGPGDMLDNQQVAAGAPPAGMEAEPGRMAAAIGQMIAQQRDQQIQMINQETEQALQKLTQIMHQAAAVNPTIDESALPQATPTPSGY